MSRWRVLGGRVLARGAGALALCAMLVALDGCGGGGNSPTTPSTPTSPSQANIAVSYSATSWQSNYVSGFAYAFVFTVTVRETAGLSAKGNYLRAQFYSGADGTGTALERQEIGGNTLGTLAANGTETIQLFAGINDGNTASVTLTTNFTDSKGNVLENKQTFNCCG